MMFFASPQAQTLRFDLQQSAVIESEIRGRFYPMLLIAQLTMWYCVSYYLFEYLQFFTGPHPWNNLLRHTLDYSRFFVGPHPWNNLLTHPRSLLGIVAAGAIVIYLGVSATNPCARYLWRVKTVEDLIAYIRRIRASPPRIGLTWECYHFENRTRQVQEPYTEYQQQYDSFSKSYRMTPVTKFRSRTETYQVKIVSSADRYDFRINRWSDVSDELNKSIRKFLATRVDFEFVIVLSDEASSRYVSEHSHVESIVSAKDTFFEIHDFQTIDGYYSKALCLVDRSFINRVMLSIFAYLLSAALGLSWFYARWFDARTAHGAFLFRKQVFR
jgi:hypothetical protein